MPAVGVVELSSLELAAHDDQRDLGAADHADLVRALRRVLPSRPLVLDAAGGSGTAVPALHEAGARVVLVDWLSAMLHAAGRYAAVRISADLTRLPFASASFDAVHAAYALQNLSDWRTGLTECARVLRPGGAMVVAWGGPPADERLGALEGAYFAAVEDYVGVRAERSGLTLTAAHDVLAGHGCYLAGGRRGARQPSKDTQAGDRTCRTEPLSRTTTTGTATSGRPAGLGLGSGPRRTGGRSPGPGPAEDAPHLQAIIGRPRVAAPSTRPTPPARRSSAGRCPAGSSAIGTAQETRASAPRASGNRSLAIGTSDLARPAVRCPGMGSRLPRSVTDPFLMPR